MAMKGGFIEGFAKSLEFEILLESIQPATTASNEIHQSTHVPLPLNLGVLVPVWELHPWETSFKAAPLRTTLLQFAMINIL
jgi:hypothetical protein